MKQMRAIAGVLAVSAGVVRAEQAPGTFGYDVDFVAKHTKALVLENGDAQVLVAPDYQGRVMTSTTGGRGGPSYGWLNYKVIEKGLLTPEAAKGKLEEHIYVFGGEERFWMGPEGGQYSIYFAPGTKFEFDTWKTPAVIDTEPFEVTAASKTSASFAKDFLLKNYSGTMLKGRIDRTVKLLDSEAAATAFGIKLGEGVKAVAYETDNRITNKGDEPWTKDKGLLSIWMLGMYKPSPGTTIVIPFKSGTEADLGIKVTDTYFGKVPPDYLTVKDDVLFFRADGTRRNKIGISPKRSKGIAGSYDADSGTLNLVTYNVPETHDGYVNSLWELQKEPYNGDAINSYNDGSPGEGKPPLGPFYEIETSSPAAALKPGAQIRHVSRTLHVQGPKAVLEAIAREKLGAGLDEITAAFKKQ